MTADAITRLSLLAVTFVVVISDSLLVPFFPRFFSEVLGVVSSVHVGAYVGATCLTVMLAYPLWARVARGRSTLTLLVYTQLAAGTLALAASQVATPTMFWASSLGMVFFKGSYLLIYPFLIARTPARDQSHVIGILTVIVHFGAISGAVLGGSLLESLAASRLFLVMAGADYLQTLVCVGLRWIERREAIPEAAEPRVSARGIESAASNEGAIYRLCAIMLGFCFSAFLTRPFFVPYWVSVSGVASAAVSGGVFAIPGGVALVALFWNRRRDRAGREALAVPVLFLVGALGLAGQAVDSLPALIAGRVVYGCALFQLTVGLERQLFDLSTTDSYATDFAKLHVAQNAGALLASLAAGMLVERALALPLLVGSLGFAATALAYRMYRRSARSVPGPVLGSVAFEPIPERRNT